MFVTTKQQLPSTSGNMTISDKLDVALQQLQSNMASLMSQGAKEKAAVKAEQMAVCFLLLFVRSKKPHPYANGDLYVYS